MMPIEVQVFLYVRNKLFCTKLLLYFMPDAHGCRARAQMLRARADAAHTRGCRAHARMPRARADAARAAVCGTSISFAVKIFKDILNYVYRGSNLS
jgi:hypothetical protein